MTRVTFFATAAIGITISLAACNDSPVQPNAGRALRADQGASFSRGGDDRKKKGGRAQTCQDILPANSPAAGLCALPSIIQAICTPGAVIPPVMLGAITITVTRTPTGLLITLTGGTLPLPGVPIPITLTPAQLAALCNLNLGQDCDDDDNGKRKDRDHDSDERRKGRDR